MSREHWWKPPASAVLVVSGLVGLTGVSGSLAWTATTDVLRRWQQRGDLAFDDLVACCAVVVLAVTLGWLGVGVLLTLGTQALRCTHTAAGRLARRMTPSLVRRLLAGACGAAMLTAPAVSLPATAAPADHADARPAQHRPAQHRPGSSSPSTPWPGALPVPDRPTRADARAVARPSPHPQPRVRVRPGDTLWAIAARHLRPDARVADVATAWPFWFRRNRRLIGPDPDLIHPGTRLRVPPRPH